MVQCSNGSIQLYFWADRNVSEEYRMILPFLLLQWETRICLIKKPSRTEPKVFWRRRFVANEQPQWFFSNYRGIVGVLFFKLALLHFALLGAIEYCTLWRKTSFIWNKQYFASKAYQAKWKVNAIKRMLVTHWNEMIFECFHKRNKVFVSKVHQIFQPLLHVK